MAIMKFTSASMPRSSEDFRQTLRQALENTLPLDDFVQVITDLTQYEIRYSMKSDVFHARFEAGELGDALDLIRWANKYEIYQEIKAELEQMVELVDAYALPVMAYGFSRREGLATEQNFGMMAVKVTPGDGRHVHNLS